ncbi:MAG: alpha-ketoacid dehydrogenase subunit beta [Nanoarchaeota archaeon]|nr:alpha-ketoacid dehydrogenase subunit beta [Nanoarchaeota archaeon]
MPNLNMVDAINLALKQEMKKDKTVFLFGEDIGIDGGVFRVTEGLQKLYKDRVYDTPLAESGIVGTSFGMAISGLKPVCEIQFEGFLMSAFDQIVNHVSRIRNRSRGRFTCPMVIRCPIGGGIKALEHHSDSPEAYFMHTPGIKVVIPSTPSDAKGLLIAAIRDPDPVIFFEPKRIYRAIKEEVSDKEYIIPIGKAKIVQEGTDVTVISYGASVRECQQAVELVKKSIEIIDLRTISPLDVETIITSVKKTGRVVVVHEAQKTGGVGAEIIALINEHAILDLQAPVERVTGYDIIVPLAKLEEHYTVNEQRIAEAINKVVNF